MTHDLEFVITSHLRSFKMPPLNTATWFFITVHETLSTLQLFHALLPF